MGPALAGSPHPVLDLSALTVLTVRWTLARLGTELRPDPHDWGPVVPGAAPTDGRT